MEVDEEGYLKPTRYRRVGRSRHPMLQCWPPGEWRAEAVGVVRHYPKTPEAFEARREHLRRCSELSRKDGHMPNRRGVPDGWGGRKKELKMIKERAAELAKQIFDEATAQGLLKTNLRGEVPILGALETILATDAEGEYLNTTRDRLAAMRLVADFCVAKPEQSVKAKLVTAEDFLALVARDSSTNQPTE